MSQWVIKGIRTGIKTTAYPGAAERAAGVTPGLPRRRRMSAMHAAALEERCPTHALRQADGKISVDYRRCVHCYRCLRGVPRPLAWQPSYEWAGSSGDFRARNEFDPPFRRSIHMLVVDAGDCGACLNEVKQLNNPYYNMHRLGFFITPTPRHADVLLVVGPVTDHMRVALKKTYDAMPTPKRVVAVGACALSGGRVRGELRLCQRRGGAAAGGRGGAGQSAAAARDPARPARGGRTQAAGGRWSPLRRHSQPER